MKTVLSGQQIQDLAQLYAIANQFGADLVIIGAIALLCFINELSRFTRDIDLVIALDLEDFSRFSEALVSHGWTRERGEEHRWRSPIGTVIDLVPAVVRINNLISTHYHHDHMGGVEPLSEKMPIDRFIDHGPSLEYKRSEDWWRELKGRQYREDMGKQYDEMYAGYLKAIAKGKHIIVKPGGRIPVKGLDVVVVAAGGKKIASPLRGGGLPSPGCAETRQRLDDYEEDGQSIGTVVSTGKFRLAYLGDLTWNLSKNLFCPVNPIGPVDAYVITHHARSFPKEAGENSWSLSSCTVPEVHGLRPRVAVLSLGWAGHRGGVGDAMQTVRSSPGLEDVWQTQVIKEGGEKDYNSPEQFIANVDRGRKTAYIKLSVAVDGSFTVTNSRSGFSKTYAARK